MSVLKAINAVQSDIAKIGVAKDQRNQQQGFSFRGIDQIYNALSPLMAKHGLIVLPKVVSREVVERVSGNGRALMYVTVNVEYTLASVEGGDTVGISAYGEAMDSGDKATNKAMSAAYKYAMFQTFCIPTEAQDADETAHEVLSVEEQRLRRHFEARGKWMNSIKAYQDAVARGDVSTAYEAWSEINHEDAIAIYGLAPTVADKLGIPRCLSTEERAFMKSDEWAAERKFVHKGEAA